MRVDSRGNFPMAAGLASSAAGFAALALAAPGGRGAVHRCRPRCRGWPARAAAPPAAACRVGCASGTAATRADGADSVATQAFAESHWPELRLLAAVLSRSEKEVSSRDGMAQTVETSPYYPAWVEDAEAEIGRATDAIARRDIEALGALSERNAWRMHATAFAADPPLCYLLPSTLGLILASPAARRRGVPVWFTLDAGPNPVLLTLASHEAEVERLAREAGAVEVVRCRPGGDARLVES